MINQNENIDNWNELACAIVKQAVTDYMVSIKQIAKGNGEKRLFATLWTFDKLKANCEKFFASEYCWTLCEMDGNKIMRECQKRQGGSK